MGVKFDIKDVNYSLFEQGDILKHKEDGELGLLLRVEYDYNELFCVFYNEKEDGTLNRMSDPQTLNEIKSKWDKVADASEVQIDIYKKGE